MINYSLRKILKTCLFVLVTTIDNLIKRKSEVKAVNSNKLLIVKIDGIGDYILFRNFLKLIKESGKFKNYSITLCANIINKDIAEQYDKEFVNEFIWIEPIKLATNLKYRKSIKQIFLTKNFDYAIQPTLSRQSLIGDSIIKFSSAQKKIGSSSDMNNISTFELLFTDKYFDRLINVSEQTEFEFIQNKKFFSSLTESTINISVPYINTDKPNHYGKYILITPGSGSKRRQWALEKYRQLISNYPNYTFIISGSLNDLELSNKISENFLNVINITGKYKLNELVGLIHNSLLLVSGDTG